jgi:hypothetical protein
MLKLTKPKASGVQIGDVDGKPVVINPEWDRFLDALAKRAGGVSGMPMDAPIAPTMVNGWVNFGAPYGDSSYYIDQFGMVRLAGVLKSGAVAAAAFILQSGYRPASTVRFAVDSNGAHGVVTVDAAGNVVLAIGSNVSFSLDGITFRAA